MNLGSHFSISSHGSTGSFTSSDVLRDPASATSNTALAGSSNLSEFSTFTLPDMADMNQPALDPIELARANASTLSRAFNYRPSTRHVEFAGSTPQEVAMAKEAALAGSHFGCPDVSSPVTRSGEFDLFLRAATRAYDTVRKQPNLGRNASYIAALQWRDPKDFGISIVTPDGGQISMGDARVPFSIQSTSKPIDLLLALENAGMNGVNSVVAEKASPMPFNAPSTVGSVILARQILAESDDAHKKSAMNLMVSELMAMTKPELTSELADTLEMAGDSRPVNAMCNMGALATSSQISSRLPVAGDAGKMFDLRSIGQIYNSMEMARKLGRPANGDPLFDIDFNVYASEIATASSNQALARQNVLGNARLHDVRVDDLALDAFEQVDIYTNNCAMRTNIAGLTSVFATIANKGVNPFTREQVVPSEHADVTATQMKKGGLYEESEEFFRETGLIAKSGVGGAIVAFHPKTGLTIGTYSTPLDKDGNSFRGMDFLRTIADSPEFKALVDSIVPAPWIDFPTRP